MFASRKIVTLAAAAGFVAFSLAINSTAEAGLIVTPRMTVPSEVTPAVLKPSIVANQERVKKPVRTRVAAVKSPGKPLSLLPRRVASLNTVQTR